MNLKKCLAGIAVSCLLFNTASGVLAAAPAQEHFPDAVPYTDEESGNPTPPEPSTDPTPEPAPDPTPNPDPPATPAPAPDPGPAATPDTGDNNNSYDYSADDYYSDDSDTYYDDSYDDTSDDSDSAGVISEDSQSTEEKPQEVQQVQGDQPMTITAKETSIDVTVDKKVYTTGKSGDLITVDFNKDVLNTAVAAGKAKLDEKRKGGDTKLERVRILIPKIEIEKLSETGVSLRVLGESLNALNAAKASLVVPVNNIAYTVSSELLSADDLKDLGNDGRLMVEIHGGAATQQNSYEISDAVLSPQADPVNLEITTVKASGAMATLEHFNSPMTLYVTVGDDVASRLNDKNAFAGVVYDAGNDTMDAKPTSYRTDSKTIVFSVDQPGSYTVALKENAKAINPVLILVPVCALAALGVIFLILRRNKKRKQSAGNY